MLQTISQQDLPLPRVKNMLSYTYLQETATAKWHYHIQAFLLSLRSHVDKRIQLHFCWLPKVTQQVFYILICPLYSHPGSSGLASSSAWAL